MNGRPHSLSNQSEFQARPSRFASMVAAWRAKAYDINFGKTPYLPYQLGRPKGDIGETKFNVHVETPVVTKRHAHGYRGEAFLRMQPFYTRPHPSGLPDNALLRTPRGERDTRG